MTLVPDRSALLAQATATAATATVTVAAPSASVRFYISKVVVSCSAPATTAAAVVLTDTATSTAYQLAQIPVGVAGDPNQLLDLNFFWPQGMSKGGGFTVTVTTLGTGIVCDILVQYLLGN